MTAQELETLLTERVQKFDLKKIAFDSLHQILSETPEELIGGFEPHEITYQFDGYKYLIDNRDHDPIIRTSIGFYVKNDIYHDNLEPIGYYELDTNWNGEVVDDWFVIEKEKYLKDIGIISYFQWMNKKLPPQYLETDHVQYEFVSYISMVGTLFISKAFQSTGVFVHKAKTYLETTDNSLPDKDYLKASKKFLKIIGTYLIESNLITEDLKQKLIENNELK